MHPLVIKRNPILAQLWELGCIREGCWADNFSDATVTIGANEETEETVSNLTLLAKVPVDLWISGDLKWIAAAYGKENSSGHWCPWCLKSAKEWSPAEQNTSSGPFWSSALLQEYAQGVHSGRLKTSSQRKGVVADAAIDYVGPDKIVFPILHATLGFGNDWLKSFVKEMQAASEAYSPEYLKAEEGMGNATEALEIAVRTIRQYKAQVRDAVKDAKKALRRTTNFLFSSHHLRV